MGRKLFLMVLFSMEFVMLDHRFSHSEQHTASQFSVHIFSSANFIGYLEPCG